MFWAALTLGDYPEAAWRQRWAAPADSDPGMMGDDTATIGSSQMYASKATRREGIRSVMVDATSARFEEVGG